jgi:transcriptional regulator with XRE-family HTH domain
MDQLGEYLKNRRDHLSPEDVGLPRGARRRVPGLRREEVAQLAGISSEYYLRLEQGRVAPPSDQVLDALARVFMLDADATIYMHRIAQSKKRRPSVRGQERVPPTVTQLVMSRTHLPMLVLNRYQDFLIVNPMATALASVKQQGGNALRAHFTNPDVQRLYRTDWERIAGEMVAALRGFTGSEANDPHRDELVGELSTRSDQFRRLWATHEARPRLSASTVVDHPMMGRMRLTYEKLAVVGANDQTLVIFHAEPGSRSEESLMLLARLAAQPDTCDRDRFKADG